MPRTAASHKNLIYDIMVIMEAITRQVRDIEQRERQVLEHMLGHQLKENQQIIIQVMDVASDKSQSPKAAETWPGRRTPRLVQRL